MKAIENVFDKIRPHFVDEGKLKLLWPVFELAEVFWLTPGETTHRGAHIRDPMDLKRLMIFVNFALMPAILFAMWNTGYQAYLAEGLVGADGGLIGSIGWFDFIVRGLWHFIPIYAVTLMAGGIPELLFAIVRKHEINEGFLVSSLLFPLIVPPTIPLWMVALGIIFGVVIGKEVFGGVGMNILNPALTGRAFIFFAYPAFISGARDTDGYGVWDAAGSWFPLAAETVKPEAFVDGYSGATPLLAAGGADAANLIGSGHMRALDGLAAEGWGFTDLFLGLVPGSMGEVSAAAILLGAVFLVVTGIASWRIMLGSAVGLLTVTSLFYFGFGGGVPGWEMMHSVIDPQTGAESLQPVWWSLNAMFTLPPHYHLVMGGFLFGAVFMATDPVSSAITPTGRIVFGIFVGVLCGLVRVVNPAYPEGMMLAILFMNVFAPLIDYFVVKATTRRRIKRMAATA